MFTKTALLAFLATMATAAPTARDASDIVRFDAVSAHSTSPIHLQSISAYDNKFILNVASSASCPTDQCPAIDCSQYTNTTIFSFDTTGTTLSLDAVVPGGQIVWVDSTGALAYSVAGNPTVPSNVADSPFTYTPPVSQGYVGLVQFNGKDFEACPISTGGYQVFAQGAAGYVPASDCIDFQFITATWKGADAYQY